MKPLYIAVLILMAILTLVRLGHTQQTKEQDTATISTSGASVTFQDRVGSQTNSFEMVVGGTPASVSVTIVGCMRGGTCSSALTTSTSTTSAILAVSGGPYDFYRITGTFTGGSSPTLVFNRTGTVAKSGSGTGGSAFSSLTSGTNTTAAMVVGSGASLVPSGTGQMADSTPWLPVAPAAIFPPQHTLTNNITGGTINTGTLIYTAITYVGLATTVPGPEVNITSASCTGGNQCSITVNMPTSCTAGNLPTGVTGCTVWDVTNTTQTEKQQTASANCVNITSATCVIGTVATGASLTWPVNTGTTPPNIQPGAITDKIINSVFIQKGDGNYYPFAGVDISALNFLPNPKGTFTVTDRFFINDSNATPIISNTLFSIHHLPGTTTGTGSTADDRAMGVEMVNGSTVSPAFNQYLGYYGETLQQNAAFTCAAAAQPGTAEDCQAGLRSRTNINIATSASTVGGVGIHGVASTNVTNPNLGSCLPCLIGVAGQAGQETVNNPVTSASYAGVTGYANAASGNSGGGFGYSFWALAPAIRFTQQNGAFFIPSGFSNAADFAIRSDATAISRFRGDMNLFTLSSNQGGIAINSSITGKGGESTIQVTAPTNPPNSSILNIGTAGAVSYSYQLVFRDAANGTVTRNQAVMTTGTGNATLDGTNFNRINIGSTNFCAAVPMSTIDVYRTASAGAPATTGKIGTITVTDCSGVFAGFTLDDTGLAADGTVVPTANTTGGQTAAGYMRGTLNLKQVAADFTSAGNTSLQTITGLTWTTLTTARNYSFHCSLMYSQATAAVAMQFGIQVATIAPTNVNAKARVDTSATAQTSGVLNGLTTTTATPIATFTPSATATVFGADLDGTAELPAGENVINIMVQTSAAADLPTVKRGSYCELY